MDGRVKKHWKLWRIDIRNMKNLILYLRSAKIPNTVNYNRKWILVFYKLLFSRCSSTSWSYCEVCGSNSVEFYSLVPHVKKWSKFIKSANTFREISLVEIVIRKQIEERMLNAITIFYSPFSSPYAWTFFFFRSWEEKGG